MQRRRLGVADREVAVAAQRAPEQEHVPGAVHRLDAVHLVVLERDQEHALAELLPVARGLPQCLVVDERRLHLEVAALRVLAPAEILERVEDRHSLRMPQRRPRRVLVEVEEIELVPEPAVVALARLLQPLEVRVEILLVVERRPVNARELRLRRVAAPVRAGEAGELQRLDRFRVLQVRAAAEVGELPLRVQGNVSLRGVDELDLVRLVLRGEQLARLVARDLLARPLATLGELAFDLRLDRVQVLLADRLRKVEVVVEAVLDRRTDGDLHARVETSDCLGQQVCRGVAEDGERIGVVLVAGGQKLDPLTVVEWQPQVLHAAVGAHEHRLLGELRSDRARRIETGRAVGKFELGFVGEHNLHVGQGYSRARSRFACRLQWRFSGDAFTEHDRVRWRQLRKDFQLAKEFALRMMKTSDARRILRTVVATELAQ